MPKASAWGHFWTFSGVIAFEISFWAMEKCGWTSFSRTIGFDRSRMGMENRRHPELSSSVWQPLISHLTAMITVAVVLTSALREFLSRWTPNRHFLSPHTSPIKKSLIRWKTPRQLLAIHTIDVSIISARMETSALLDSLPAFRSIHTEIISWSMESTFPV